MFKMIKKYEHNEKRKGKKDKMDFLELKNTKSKVKMQW